MIEKGGFTLVEIMIVVAIIGILAALAISSLVQPKIRANESMSIYNLRQICTACEIFRASGSNAFPQNLPVLSNATPPYLSVQISSTNAASGFKGYYYTYTRLNNNQFACFAQPLAQNITGKRIFYIDESGIIRENDASGAVVE